MGKNNRFNQSSQSNWNKRGFKKSGSTSNICTGSNSIPINPPTVKQQRDFCETNVIPKNNSTFSVAENKTSQKEFSENLEQNQTHATPKAKKQKGTGLDDGHRADENHEDAPHAEQKPGKQVAAKRRKQKFTGYVLFIGNLSYDTTREDILQHFSKIGKIKDVRLPVNKEDNKPRGFAYLDLEDHVAYEKALSLHHSFLKRRRINVECTFGGSKTSQKRKALIKQKTLKLRFLSREGKISTANKKQWGKKRVDSNTAAT